MAYRLGIDLGTSTTVAVLAVPSGGPVRPLLFDASPLLSSAVFAGAGPELLTGLDAERAATAQPAGLEANPKRRIDDGTVWLGEREYPIAEVLAAVLRRVGDEARRVAGEPVTEVVLTHPAAWGRTRLGLLADAAARAGLGEPGLVPEPVAAAAYFATVRELDAGQCLVVYDLGAGTFDVSVVRRLAGGFEVVAADGLADVGGLDLDAAVVQHARGLTAGATEAWGRLDWPQNHADQQARRALWTGARATKEQLTRHATADLHLPLVDTAVHLTREEFEHAARPYLDRTVALTVKVLRDAGAAPERIGGVFLVGGSSRIPLAATLLHRTLRIAPTIVEQPELVVAEGSLLAPTTRAEYAPPTAELHPVVAPPVSPAAPVPVVPAAPVSPAVSTVDAPPKPQPPKPATPKPATPKPATPKPQPPKPVAPKRGRGRLVLVALVVVALAAVGGGVYWWRGRGPVVAELEGHAGAVRAVAFSPDGTRLVTAGDDKTVRLWNVSKRSADGAPLTAAGPLRAVAYSPDGKLIAAAGDDQKIHVWNAATRAELDPIPRPSRTFVVNALAFDASGAMLAVGGEGGVAIVYRLADGSPAAELDPLPSGAITALAFNPRQADRIVVGGDRPEIIRYTTASGAAALPVETVIKHSGTIRAVASSPDGVTAASGGTDGAVLLWPDQAGVAASKLTGHSGAVNAVAFDRTGARLASGGDDGTVRIWNTSGRTAIGSPYAQSGSPVEALSFSPTDANVLATASKDGVVRLWDLS
ncbi:Hsp70 family protein [Dactylosporangium sp. CA-139066]|uniref:Hsp70 family protein n=1 Tax=Dactylosporangium sp. CA-139066 TaxID=3239930 RepID=UPI003D945D9E